MGLAAALAAFSSQAFSAESDDIPVLDRARAAANMIPGVHPHEVRFQGFFEFQAPLSQFVAGGSDEPARWVYGVFQLRFEDGWIMVDSGADKEFTGSDGFSDASYSDISAALAQAKLNILTHEHSDHALGLVRGESSGIAASNALVTVEQLNSMLSAEEGLPIPRISTEISDRFYVVSYEGMLPIAPGVVLIKAPGHSRGSQMVFVALESGNEVLLVGDIVWHEMQIRKGLQKGPASDSLRENRDSLKTQIEWLQDVANAGIDLVIAHDLDALEAQIEDGILKRGIVLPP